MNFKRILVTSDLSDASQAAFSIVGTESNSEVHVVNVIEELELPLSTEPLSVESGSKVKADLLESRRLMLKQAWEKSSRAKVEFHVLFASTGAAHEICDFAKRIKADLIVSASHGRGMIQDLLVGSVIQKVIRGAHCPVLVVPVKS